MSTDEVSIGPVYVAAPPVTRRFFRPQVVEIVEMCEPWRTGKAFILPLVASRALVIGIWTRDIQDDIAVDFPDEWPDFMMSWESEDNEPSPKWLKGAWLKDWNATEEEEATGGTEES